MLSESAIRNAPAQFELVAHLSKPPTLFSPRCALFFSLVSFIPPAGEELASTTCLGRVLCEVDPSAASPSAAGKLVSWRRNLSHCGSVGFILDRVVDDHLCHDERSARRKDRNASLVLIRSRQPVHAKQV